MANDNWYKFSFEIVESLEEIIIWKLNDLEIFSFAFESLLNKKDKKQVNIWLPVINWDKNSRKKLESLIGKFLEKNNYSDCNFNWSVIENENWLSSWKKYWGPEPIGKTLLILPFWLALPEEFGDKKVIKIDPGAAFGTGGHPSTALCLEKMEDLVWSRKKILDIGSGSGILSIAARSLGAKEIHAVDNDYLAIKSTKSNFDLNFGSSKQLNTYLGSFGNLFFKNNFKNFDLILCNILAETIKSIIPYISKSLKNNGTVILSGILNSQKSQIIKTLNLNYLKIVDISSKKDWVCIEAQKSFISLKA